MACPSCHMQGVQMPRPWRNPQVVASATSGLLLLVGFIGGYVGLPLSLQTVLYVIAVVTGGYYFGREALEELVKEHEIGIELLMSVAAIVAGVMGQWAEAARWLFFIRFPRRRRVIPPSVPVMLFGR